MQGRDPILIVAERVVPSIFDRMLEAAGFSVPPERQDGRVSKQWLYQRAWERPTGGQRPHYVALTLSVEPRDIPWFLGVTLGEGSNRLPEREWKGVPLWRVVVAGRGSTGSPPTYGIAVPEDVEPAVRAAASDISTHAAAFLHGELGPLLEVRAPQTEGRTEFTTRTLQEMVAEEAARVYARLAIRALIFAAVAGVVLRLLRRRT